MFTHRMLQGLHFLASPAGPPRFATPHETQFLRWLYEYTGKLLAERMYPPLDQGEGLLDELMGQLWLTNSMQGKVDLIWAILTMSDGQVLPVSRLQELVHTASFYQPLFFGTALENFRLIVL